MRLVITESLSFDLLELLLSDDPHPWSRFIRENLMSVKGDIEARSGKIIYLTERLHPYRLVGAVAVSMRGCGIVSLHFYYVYEDFRGRLLEVLPALFQAVDDFGSAQSYGYVFVTAPVGDEYRSQHDLFLPRSIERRHDVAPSGHKTITYSIPKDRFRQFCR